jgi:5-methylcytosine-specific restriction endonuclease McrA
MSSLTGNGSTRRWRRLRTRILSRDGYVCFYCGRIANTVDHLHPRALGGGDDSSNLVACCSRCNLAKGPRHLRPVEPPPPSRRYSRDW